MSLVPTTPPLVLLLIFLAGTADMTIGTLRMILSVAGLRWQAALSGAVQITFFVIAISGIVAYLGDVFAVLVYAVGYGTGVWTGMWLEERIALGYRVIHIINNQQVSVASYLRENGMRCTRIDGSGRDGPVEFAVVIVRRRELGRVLKLVHEVNPNAFVSVERAERPLGGTVTGDIIAVRDTWFRRLARRA
jgi:uncharacterized protein YebE (UPF0316 family)